MKVHFGTDGIRGKANEELTCNMAYRMGQFVGRKTGERKTKILIGRDTRLSGSMFEAALSAGIAAVGGEAYLLGVCSTPSLIYLTAEEDFDFGMMISASHNPYLDNGIKVITGQGTKMDENYEKQIEDFIYGDEEADFAVKEDIGTVIDYHEGLDKYLDRLASLFDYDLSGYRILLDCANGSATVTAEKIFRHFKANVDVIFNQPDGLNINRGCGSTHVEKLAEAVKNGSYDCGFAFDGDADRVIAVAGDGTIVDGDKIIYCCGKFLKKNGQLKNGKVVPTVMSNLGLFKKLQQEDIGYEIAPVGDKYVYECMVKNDYSLGGEQSGHIIFRNHATTGDGVLSALEIMNVIVKEGKTLNELTDDLFVYPQLLVNVPVKDKQAVLKDEEVKALCKQVEEELKGDGRILVRPSGTEPLVRVMAEASSDELCSHYVYKVVNFIKEKNL